MELYLWWDTADVGKQILKEFSVKGRPYSLTQKSDVCLSLILGSLVGDYNKSEEKSEKKKAILSLLSLNGCQESAVLVYSASLCLHLVLFSCTFLCEALWAVMLLILHHRSAMHSLPHDLRHCSTLSSFKAKLKTSLFSVFPVPSFCYSQCECVCMCVHICVCSAYLNFNFIIL